MAVPLQSFFGIFLGHLSYCRSKVFISDIIPPCDSAHPSQHPHLIYVSACFLSSCCSSGLCTIQQSWSDHSFVNFPLSFTGILLSHNTPLHLFQFPHAALTLCVIYVAMPPVSSKLEPIFFLKKCTLSSSFPRIVTGSLPYPLSCPIFKVYELGIVC